MQELEPIQTNLHNRINVCIKNLIGSFPYAFAYRPINFFMHTFMRLCKFVWIGPNWAGYCASKDWLTFLKPCVHDARNRSEFSVREMCSQSTCRFYGKAVILLAARFSDRELGTILASWTSGLKMKNLHFPNSTYNRLSLQTIQNFTLQIIYYIYN